MNASGRILALDVGDRRIGIAVSDELQWTAHGLRTLERKGPKQEVRELREIVAEYGVTRLVVGLPRNMDGSEGPRAREAIEFAEKLKTRLKVEVVTWDERLTTRAAERVMIEADVSRSKRRKKLDQVSAVIILQGYLDSIQGGGPPPE
ncbi:MAG TPA: Holliday junction resolvase RuvX, partial [Nitrospiria bacterium]|nr:Holliday junction resolvase RuvX [Nitrospiria bacterium]